MIAVYGSVAWLLVALLAVPLIYAALKPVLEALARGPQPRAS